MTPRQTPPFLSIEVIVVEIVELPEGNGIMFKHVGKFRLDDTGKSGEAFDVEVQSA